jgi:hypothetical protein
MAIQNASILTAASRQWASRPSDERFTSLLDLQDHVNTQRDRSRGKIVSSRGVTAQPDPSCPHQGLVIVGKEGHAANPSHFAFGQLANLAGAPAGYLRGLPAPLAADCINYGLKIERGISDVGLLLRREENIVGDDCVSSLSLVAATGPKYGRIWNSDVVNALVDRVGDGITGGWRVPGEFGKAVEVTKANTTLYAGDRDMFVFLADEQNRVTIPNRRNGESGSLARGFFVQNSEVGSSAFAVSTFLFDYVCCNRIVHNARDVTELRIRHTAAAPDKWLEEALPVLEAYAHSSATPIEATLQAAQQRKIDNVEAFLKGRNWTSSLIARSQAAHEDEEGRPVETLWDVVCGATAYAKSIEHQDTRVSVERAAGNLLDLVAA